VRLSEVPTPTRCVLWLYDKLQRLVLVTWHSAA
jgi:hypothetical protein